MIKIKQRKTFVVVRHVAKLDPYIVLDAFVDPNAITSIFQHPEVSGRTIAHVGGLVLQLDEDAGDFYARISKHLGTSMEQEDSCE